MNLGRRRTWPVLLAAVVIGLPAGYVVLRHGGNAAVSGTTVPATQPASSVGGSPTGSPTGSPSPTESDDDSAATPTTATPTPTYHGPAAAVSLAGKVIVIDPGHDGGNGAHPGIINQLVGIVNGRKACDTAGTETNGGYPEHAFTWDVALRLQAILRKAGATVVLTRGNDTGVGPCITQRAAIGNHARADLAISIHADGGPAGGRGFHVIEPGPVGPNDGIVAPSRRLGLDIRDAFRSGTGEPYATYTANAGIDVRTDLGGLNLSLVPKVFIECANMRNATDAGRLTDPAWRQAAAEALANGMIRYLTGH